MKKYDWFNATSYVPHAEQKEFHDSDARFRLIIAERRWGKTLSLTKEAEVLLMEPGTKGWVVAETYDMVMAIIDRMRKDLLVSPVADHKKPTSYRILEYPWGSRVEGKVAQYPQTLLGEHDIDWIVFDNCGYSKAEVWDICKAALKKPKLVAVSQP